MKIFRKHAVSVLILMFCTVILSLSKDAFAASVIDLPRTGQTKCYDDNGIVIACANTGQDGDWQAGVPWPNPRFVSGTGTEADCMTDKLTGLMWPKNANQGYYPSWTGALDIANNFTLCGHSDWRLPNVVELRSLINTEESDNAAWLNLQGFNNVQSFYYWSSTTLGFYTPIAWTVKMSTGNVTQFNKGSGFYIWPVRGSSAGSSGSSAVALPKTGQTATFYAGDDGAIKADMTWPSPRFATNSECITDNLTGLMWTKDANLIGTRSWQSALYSANNLFLCGFSDWRLPNINLS